MKKLCFLLLVISFFANSQTTNFRAHLIEGQCGTEPIEESVWRSDPTFLNDDFKIQTLKEHGFNVPSDYFDRVDERGFYGDKLLRLREFRDKIQEGIKERGGRVEAGGAYHYIRVKIWIFYSGGAVPATEAEADQYLFEMNQLFRLNDIPINFYRGNGTSGMQSISSLQYWTIDNLNELDNMHNTYDEPNAMDIYMVGELIIQGTSIAGIRRGDHLTVNLNNSSTGQFPSTLAHEVGHALNLDHTHHGYNGCGNQNNGGCWKCKQESVSRSKTQGLFCHDIGKKKCAVNGDRLCDTAGEDNLNDQWNGVCALMVGSYMES